MVYLLIILESKDLFVRCIIKFSDLGAPIPFVFGTGGRIRNASPITEAKNPQQIQHAAGILV
jgi:hypothetical protein